METSASGRSRLGAGRCGEDKGKSVLKFKTSRRRRTGAPQLSTPCHRKRKVVTNPFIRREVSAKAEKRRGPAVWLGLAGTQHQPNGTRHSGRCPKARRERHRSPRSRCKSVGRHCCDCTTMNVRCGFWPQVHPRLQSNGRSTIDAVAGDLRTNGNFFHHKQGRLVNLIAQHNFFSREGGWCRRTCKPSAGNLSRIHNPLVKFSNSLSQNGVDDLGRTVVGSNVALHVAGAGIDQATAGYCDGCQGAAIECL